MYLMAKIKYMAIHRLYYYSIKYIYSLPIRSYLILLKA